MEIFFNVFKMFLKRFMEMFQRHFKNVLQTFHKNVLKYVKNSTK